MYSAGELVVYGGEGVCRVQAVGPTTIPGADKNKSYYTLRPLYRTEQVLTPVDTRVLMRPVISAQEAQALVEQLDRLEWEDPLPVSPRALKDYYQDIVVSYDCRRMAGLLRTLARRRRQALEAGKKVSQMDERYCKRAEEQLYGELAAALGLPKEDMAAYICRYHPQWPEL